MNSKEIYFLRWHYHWKFKSTGRKVQKYNLKNCHVPEAWSIYGIYEILSCTRICFNDAKKLATILNALDWLVNVSYGALLRYSKSLMSQSDSVPETEDEERLFLIVVVIVSLSVPLCILSTKQTNRGNFLSIISFLNSAPLFFCRDDLVLLSPRNRMFLF